MDICICIAEFLHCSLEAITRLLIGITPIQNKKFKRKSPITDGIGDIGAKLATPNVSVACRLFGARKKKKIKTQEERLRKKL